MQAILDFFSGFVDLISSIVDFVVGFFTDLVYVIGLMGSFLINIPGYFGWLPPALIAVVVTTFSIVVIYMILNRK